MTPRKKMRRVDFVALVAIVGLTLLIVSLPHKYSVILFWSLLALVVVIVIVLALYQLLHLWLKSQRFRRGLALISWGAALFLFGFSAWCFSRPDPLLVLYGLRPHIAAYYALLDGNLTDAVKAHGQSMPFLSINYLKAGVGLILAGGLFTGLALHFWPRKIVWAVPVRAVLTPTRSRWLLVGLGGICLLLLTEANSPVIGVKPLQDMPTHGQFGLLCLGSMLIAWGLSGAEWPPHLPAVDRREILPVAGIMGVALVLRLWNVENTVHHLIDEVHYLNGINLVMKNPDTRLLAQFSDVTTFPYLYPYLQSWFVRIMGSSLASIRIISAIFGMLTIPALYLLARALFDRKTALLAAFLLAVFPPHIHFSRLGLNNIADPFFGTLAAAFVARALLSQNRLDYALAGVMLGLTQYFYEGGRLLYPPLIVLWLLMLWGFRRSQVSLRGVGIMLLAAVFIAAPVYYTMYHAHELFNPRMQDVGLGMDYVKLLLSGDHPELYGIQGWHNLLAFLSFVFVPDISWFYGGTDPLLLHYLVPFFLIGLFLAFWRWRTPGGLLLMLWIAGVLLGQSLLIDSTWAPRFIVFFPGMILLVALGLREPLCLLAPNVKQPVLRLVLRGAVIMLVIGMGVGQVNRYFGDHLDFYNESLSTGYDVEDALFRSLHFPPRTEVHIVYPDAYVWDINLVSMLEFWQADVKVGAMDSTLLTEDYLSGLSSEVDHAFFIDPTDERLLRRIGREFNLYGPEFSPFNIPEWRQLPLYYAPASDLRNSVRRGSP